MNPRTDHDTRPRRRAGLRRHIILFAVALGAVTLIAAISLKAVTDVMGSSAKRAEAAANAARAAETAEAHLLRFNALSDLVLATHDQERETQRAQSLGRVHADLDELRTAVEPSELAAVESVAGDVDGYVAARHRADDDHHDASAAEVQTAPVLAQLMARLDELERGETRRQSAEAERVAFWDNVGDWIGVLVIAGTLATMLSVYGIVFGPLLRLVEAMKRFGAGDRAVRADPAHNGDLAGTATTFNEMADIITGQHARMLDFLGDVSRELRDPVQVMRAALHDVASGKAAGASDEKARTRAMTVGRELDRIDHIVDGFLEASRIEWRRLDLQLGTQDLRRLAAEIAKIYDTFSARHQVALAVPDDPVCVSVDEGRIAQVVHSLLVNAIQSSPRGGMIDVSVTTDAKDAILSVTDHGVGISKDDIGKVFEPFHMAARSMPDSRHAGPSTLVALSVARRIVEAHAGRMEVESAPGQGNIFRMRLALAGAAPRPAPSAGPDRGRGAPSALDVSAPASRPA